MHYNDSFSEIIMEFIRSDSLIYSGSSARGISCSVFHVRNDGRYIFRGLQCSNLVARSRN